MSSASAALSTLAVKIKLLAFDKPSRRVSRCVPPAPGMIPSRVSGSPIFVTELPALSSGTST